MTRVTGHIDHPHVVLRNRASSANLRSPQDSTTRDKGRTVQRRPRLEGEPQLPAAAKTRTRRRFDLAALKLLFVARSIRNDRTGTADRLSSREYAPGFGGRQDISPEESPGTAAAKLRPGRSSDLRISQGRLDSGHPSALIDPQVNSNTGPPYSSFISPST